MAWYDGPAPHRSAIFGVGTSRQEWPFQWVTCRPVLMSWVPIAQMLVGDRTLATLRAGWPVCTRLQLVPLKCQVVEPKTQTSFGLMTVASEMKYFQAFQVRTTPHCRPFQRSAYRVRVLPLFEKTSPNAHAFVEEDAATRVS